MMMMMNLILFHAFPSRSHFCSHSERDSYQSMLCSSFGSRRPSHSRSRNNKKHYTEKKNFIFLFIIHTLSHTRVHVMPIVIIHHNVVNYIKEKKIFVIMISFPPLVIIRDPPFMVHTKPPHNGSFHF